MGWRFFSDSFIHLCLKAFSAEILFFGSYCSIFDIKSFASFDTFGSTNSDNLTLSTYYNISFSLLP